MPQPKRAASPFTLLLLFEEWKPFEGPLNVTTYLIPVDEFASVEIPRLDCPTREEFRKLCDEAGSAERVVELLRTP